MSTEQDRPFFSIVIATRNRPDLFRTALDSVLGQSCDEVEIIVVVDGSSSEHIETYKAIEHELGDIRFHYLYHRPTGHGQSYSLNAGAELSSGRYIGALDDDDYWTDMDYLARTRENIEACPDLVDLYLSNQKAVYSDGTPQTRAVWLEDLIPRIDGDMQNHQDSYHVDAQFLFGSEGFAHLNCSIYRRELFEQLGGLDESIRYENDRDMYLRAVDAASVILFSTRYVSMHNIPDIHKKTNMSTMSSDIEKKLFQIRVYDKGVSLASKPETVALCRRGKVYELKHTTRILAARKQHHAALHYALQALSSGFNFRWLLYTLYLAVRAMLSPGYDRAGATGRDA